MASAVRGFRSRLIPLAAVVVSVVVVVASGVAMVFSGVAMGSSSVVVLVLPDMMKICWIIK